MQAPCLPKDPYAETHSMIEHRADYLAVSWTGLRLENQNTARISLEQAFLHRVSPGQSRLTEARLTGVRLEAVNLSGVALEGPRLRRIELLGSRLMGIQLSVILRVPIFVALKEARIFLVR